MTTAPVSEVIEEVLPPYEGITAASVRVVRFAAEAQQALAVLMATDVIGFDTESKPTFNKGELSDGPHLIQLAADDVVFLFPVGRFVGQLASLAVLRTVLESPRILKVGFGLSDDLKRLAKKLGIDLVQVVDLSRALRQDSRNDVGAKSAVARFFGQRLRKSKKTSTSNWAQFPLTERQILYAADDAQVALRIYRLWQKSV
ncbi:3'-5' exonuclease [Glaciimonas immobilis]|uniref:RNA polymerase sigma factor for flagellar operon FliA n=1 Tax=Glaciimonas immobilis TaxID=728004 RepID=A0A840RS04_9BURK|nr:3'-5' exonuclease [Glaciimonas immobilis]KAF3996402.1 3'-5' exonuclease domain-containing protein 2 [Glaciimonas immobilis]MBB5201267.1 RNA polymerase sigma factor for flagellar operon FliA [Glaciimonas immobilis]